MSNVSSAPIGLLSDIRQLIGDARQRVALAVNSELTQLYWQVGQRIHGEILQGQRAEYGKQLISAVSRQLTEEYGKGWGEKQLWHCIRFAETFPDQQILYTLCRELSWSHLRLLMFVADPIKRDFYCEICRLERWSVRQLQERMNSQLFERTAISRKPDETIQHDVQQLRREQTPSPELLLKDPYILDFLGLNDRYQ
jgi:hypothetical protein